VECPFAGRESGVQRERRSPPLPSSSVDGTLDKVVNLRKQMKMKERTSE
jgi:hypothetical protein